MRRGRSRAVVIGLGTLTFGLVAASAADGATVFELSLPLDDQGATQAAVAQHGGTIQGGQFGASGWTTQTRDDYLEVLLPSGLDAREGKLVFSASNFEMSPPFSTHFWHFVLVALDPFGAAQTGLLPHGRAHLSAGHRGYWDAGSDHVAIGYWNLHDPACSAWQDCTTETGSGANFITGPAKVTWTFEWSGTAVWVTFEGPGTTSKQMDLGATSPDGAFRDDQLILSINNCGGSTSLLCGSWDEPSKRGGPLGVTYADVLLEIYGEPSAGGGGAGGQGRGGGGGAGVGAAGAGGTAAAGGTSGGGGAAGDAGATTAASPPGDDDGGCGCRVAGQAAPRSPWIAFVAGLGVAGYGRRRRRPAA